MRLFRSLVLLILTALALCGWTAGQRIHPKVYVFLATDCPIAGRFGPRLAELERRYASRGVSFIAVFPNPRETETGIKKWLSDRALGWRVDQSPELARRLGATVSPEAVLTNGLGKVLYSGRIDDSEDAAHRQASELSRALDAVLSDKPVPVKRTEAVGCPLDLATPTKTAKPGGPTWTESVAPILFAQCVSCHRAGEAGSPVFLDNYRVARGLAQKIKEVVQKHQMPPWRALADGRFHDERSLTDAQIVTLTAWADSGTPEGPASALPPLPSFPKKGSWKLGTPDVVYEMPAAYAVPAEGKDIYRCFVIPSNQTEDRWVKGIEFQPGNSAIVHHASVFIDLSGNGQKTDDADPALGYTNATPGNGPGFKGWHAVLGGWQPGHSPRRLPKGVGLRLPKGADLVLEVHYHLTGKPETDQTRFGVIFADEKIEKPFRVGDVGLGKFTIPAGDPKFPLTVHQFIENDITLYSITPHLHQLGRSMVVTAELPNGTKIPLITITDWKFNEQPSYRFKTPVKLPRSTRIDVTAVYDNSVNNPYNPHRPPQDVRWGESTDAEMLSVFFGYTADEDQLP